MGRRFRVIAIGVFMLGAVMLFVSFAKKGPNEIDPNKDESENQQHRELKRTADDDEEEESDQSIDSPTEAALNTKDLFFYDHANLPKSSSAHIIIALAFGFIGTEDLDIVVAYWLQKYGHPRTDFFLLHDATVAANMTQIAEQHAHLPLHIIETKEVHNSPHRYIPGVWPIVTKLLHYEKVPRYDLSLVVDLNPLRQKELFLNGKEVDPSVPIDDTFPRSKLLSHPFRVMQDNSCFHLFVTTLLTVSGEYRSEKYQNLHKAFVLCYHSDSFAKDKPLYTPTLFGGKAWAMYDFMGYTIQWWKRLQIYTTCNPYLSDISMMNNVLRTKGCEACDCQDKFQVLSGKYPFTTTEIALPEPN